MGALPPDHHYTLAMPPSPNPKYATAGLNSRSVLNYFLHSKPGFYARPGGFHLKVYGRVPVRCKWRVLVWCHRPGRLCLRGYTLESTLGGRSSSQTTRNPLRPRHDSWRKSNNEHKIQHFRIKHWLFDFYTHHRPILHRLTIIHNSTVCRVVHCS